MANWFWDVVGVVGAPFTYGASLVLSPSARNLVKSTLSVNDDGSDRRDNTQKTFKPSKNNEKFKMNNEKPWWNKIEPKSKE